MCPDLPPHHAPSLQRYLFFLVSRFKCTDQELLQIVYDVQDAAIHREGDTLILSFGENAQTKTESLLSLASPLSKVIDFLRLKELHLCSTEDACPLFVIPASLHRWVRQ